MSFKGGWTDGEEGEEGGEISPMCESIGHWPLWGHCPKMEKIPLDNIENLQKLKNTKIPIE